MYRTLERQYRRISVSACVKRRNALVAPRERPRARERARDAPRRLNYKGEFPERSAV